MSLKRCPCWESPIEVNIEESSAYIWATASSNCVGDWARQFREFVRKPLEERQQAAARAWNELPRGEK